jgi:sulfur-oxidizing protein SoxY
MQSSDIEVCRREVIVGAAAIAVTAVVSALPARATADEMAAEMHAVLGKTKVQRGRVKVTLPELTENGNSTSLSVAVESPMTATDHVRAIHIFSEKNPVPHIARFGIGPHAGRAEITTSIRVADSQTITAVAEMSDGSFWSGEAQTEVTTPACIDTSDMPR